MKFDLVHYNFPDGSPSKCKSCGGIEFNEVVKSSDGGVVSEYEVRCRSCTVLCGYWAYGHFDPEFAWEGIF